MKIKIKVLDEEIPVDIYFRNRKSMELQIQQNGDLIVLAPKGIKKEQIIVSINKKIHWIIKKRISLEENKLLKKELQELNEVYFFGEKYEIQVNGNKDKDYVILDGKRIIINTNNHDRNYITKLLKNWYWENARIILKEKVDYFSQIMGLKYNRITIKDQKTRWGSCSNLNNLNFNYRIIMAPENIMDYLVVHELSHIKHMNHSREYWEYLGQWIPDYKTKRRYLKENGKKFFLP